MTRDAWARRLSSNNLTGTGYWNWNWIRESWVHRAMHRAKTKRAIELESRNNVRYRLQLEAGTIKEIGPLISTGPPNSATSRKVPALSTIPFPRKGRSHRPNLEMSDSISYAGPNWALLRLPQATQPRVELWIVG